MEWFHKNPSKNNNIDTLQATVASYVKRIIIITFLLSDIMDVLETFIYQGCKIFNPNGSKEDWDQKYSYDCTHFPVWIILVKLNVIADFEFNILIVVVRPLNMQMLIFHSIHSIWILYKEPLCFFSDIANIISQFEKLLDKKLVP